LQYEGIWIESLATADGDDRTARALFHRAVEDAKQRDVIDEIGYVLPPAEATVYEAAVGEGFKKVNEYLVFEQELSRENACL
jgi:hypothetical protein